MEACVAELAPSPETGIETKPTNEASVQRWLVYGLAAVVGVGVLWRVVRYLGGFPIWGDEAMLLISILERDYAGLTQQLRFGQVAPLFFLWLERSALLLLGPSEWSMHLFPFLAGLLTLAFFWRMCRASFSPRIAGMAVAILAISYYPVRHSAEVKPYAFDLLFSVIFACLTLEHLRNPATTRWLIALSAVTPIAMFSSYPSAFVGGAVSIVLLMCLRSASWTQRGWYALFNVLLCGSFLIHYVLIGQGASDPEELRRAREFMLTYWKDAFPPENPLLWPVWLVKVLTGNMLAYPMGANNGGSAATFLLVALGAFACWRTGQRALLALCGLPFALNLLAAMLGKYPFGGSARIMLHLAPFIAILMAHGIAQALDWIRSPRWRTRWELGIYLAFFGFGAVGIARDVVKPYKTEHDREMRRLVLDMHRQIAPGEPVFLCHVRDEDLLPEFLWYARTKFGTVDWLSTSAIPFSTKSCWLVLCSHQEASAGHVAAHADSRSWRITATDTRAVPGENAKMPTMFCRWVRLERE
ncbi:MAG: glycosyltransferase family 39 protein [Planctomycetes bacterium]|nr:glycosyltransferase family 39 protein [Planctomycetota bacterium]